MLANDLADPGTTLTITSAGAASQGGSLSVVNGTAIIYQPAANFFGTETFTYTVNDGTPGNDSTATVTVTVTPVNDAPTAVDDSFSAAVNSSGNLFSVLGNDTILPDSGETLTITAATAGSHGGTVTVVGGQQILYTPVPGFSGQETFTYTVNDGTPGSNDTATVTVTVSEAQIGITTVRVRLTDTDYLQLNEVVVLEQGTGTNLALAGVASQSSTYSTVYPAEKAIDGQTSSGTPLQ